MSREFIPAAKPIIGDEERAAVDAVMASGMVVQGPQVAAFEEEFSAQVAAGAHSVAVNSGTSAQHLATLACALKAGGGTPEVIVPSFTFAATGNSVAITGAKPVFADIDPVTFTLDPASVEAAITENTVAIEVVHLYGLPADMGAIMEIAARHDLAVFEDCAQAHGAAVDGKPVGTFGAWGSFSFYPTKNMTTLEGGMVTTSDAELARRVRLLRNQGMDKQYANELVGLNNRMTDVAAAVGRVQLKKLGGWTETRRANAAALDAGLAAVPGVLTPAVPDGYRHVYHQYTIRLDGATAAERDAAQSALREEWQVGTGVYYPIPNHRLESLAPYAPDLELPNTELVARECLSLPVHPSLSEADLERIVQAVAAVVKAGA
ncbi:MAG: DegT/DnrJ/EryC1/StrS family aminotransferase [Actinomyces ruminicola]|uniref:dTDP-4-amino-4,6-dideoxygalactose transaminase n=1 Tax=Actinomyces ruminicola TaxID=332524 RepID=A0A1G9SNE0_9ACTO|nr:DegT/DnrJ/EryC1/StrS family aminotransferase [Actinomyces ruminicola]MBE6482509.1 DegT/DnrJ/EryC1/StrS family aminotransferase [Actinomyces ruminicola]SDM37033.1 dTDP-4-amino-4,6-dideoxygalactose transaminase [Actinomyces ruminicola]